MTLQDGVAKVVFGELTGMGEHVERGPPLNPFFKRCCSSDPNMAIGFSPTREQDPEILELSLGSNYCQTGENSPPLSGENPGFCQVTLSKGLLLIPHVYRKQQKLDVYVSL